MTAPRPPGNRPTGTPPNVPPQKPAGTRSLVEQIVAEQKEQKADLKAAMERRNKSSKLAPIAAGVLVVANVAGWLIFPPTRDTRGDRRTPVQVERDLRLVVSSAAAQVDYWRRKHNNEFPADLAQAGVRDTGIAFVKIDSAVYELRGRDHAVFVTYRSNMRISDFLDAGLGGKR